MSLNEIERKNAKDLYQYIEDNWPDTEKIILFLVTLLDSGSFYARDYIESLGEKAYEKWNDGTNFEESIAHADVRIVDNLRNEMAELVGIGVSVAEAAEYLSERFFATRVHDLGRIMVTEKTRIDAETVVERGERYIYHCVHDSKTCQYCENLDGMVFLSSDADFGENCPPMHPWCRCWLETVE